MQAALAVLEMCCQYVTHPCVRGRWWWGNGKGKKPDKHCLVYMEGWSMGCGCMSVSLRVHPDSWFCPWPQLGSPSLWQRPQLRTHLSLAPQEVTVLFIFLPIEERLRSPAGCKGVWPCLWERPCMDTVLQTWEWHGWAVVWHNSVPWLRGSALHGAALGSLFQVLVMFLLHSCFYGHQSQTAFKPVFSFGSWPTEVCTARR